MNYSPAEMDVAMARARSLSKSLSRRQESTVDKSKLRAEADTSSPTSSSSSSTKKDKDGEPRARSSSFLRSGTFSVVESFMSAARKHRQQQQHRQQASSASVDQATHSKSPTTLSPAASPIAEEKATTRPDRLRRSQCLEADSPDLHYGQQRVHATSKTVINNKGLRLAGEMPIEKMETMQLRKSTSSSTSSTASNSKPSRSNSSYGGNARQRAATAASQLSRSRHTSRSMPESSKDNRKGGGDEDLGICTRRRTGSTHNLAKIPKVGKARQAVLRKRSTSSAGSRSQIVPKMNVNEQEKSETDSDSDREDCEPQFTASEPCSPEPSPRPARRATFAIS